MIYIVNMAVLFLCILCIFCNIEYVRTELCGKILTSSSGTISPPRKNGTYMSNSFCRWEISSHNNRRISLVSTQFAVEQDVTCRWDYLEVRDGVDTANNSIGRFCGYEGFRYLSMSSKVYLYFVSDELMNENGFIIDFFETDEGDISKCNSIINSETFITSPRYPSYYPSSTTCLYRIIAPTNTRISLDILQMSIADDSCLFDKLEVFDGSTSHSTKLATLCGDTLPDKIKSTGHEMLLVFQTDYMVESRGFLADVTYERGGLETVDHSNKISSDNECDIKITGKMNGTIASPGFPKSYDNNLNCTITILSPVPDHQIMIKFAFMELEESENCTFDRLTLFPDFLSDQSDIHLCGLKTPKEIFYSKEGSMRLQLTTDRFVTWSGYSANYTIIPREVCYPRCDFDSVCVKDDQNYRCVKGQKCNTNVCNNGFCVKKGLADVQCFCQEGYQGVFCNEPIVQTTEKLVFVKTPLDQAVAVDSRVLLECKVNDEKAEYLWFFEDLLLQTDVKTLTAYQGGVLDLHRFTRELEGLYKCLASTQTDFTEHEFRLTVAEPCDISIDAPPVNTIVEEGEVALLSCFSQHALNVTWYKDDVLIKEAVKFKTLSDGQYLAISNTVPRDSGSYTCEISDVQECRAQRTAQLSVIPASGFNSHCARDVLVSNPRVRMIGRIANGLNVETNSAPWHAMLRMRSKDKTFCGANLISKSWLITAAHCIRHFHIEFKEEFSVDKVDIYLGTNSCKGKDGVKYAIKSYIVHPDFGNHAVYDNDIALIELDRVVDFTSQIQPVCLQPASIIKTNYLTHTLGRRIGRVIGCGQFNEFWKASPESLREVFVPYVDRQDCAAAKIGQGNFTKSMFCAGFKTKNRGDSCFGDSGGSLTMRLSENHPWVLVGIVSWGVGCDREDHYGYYTHVAEFETWIQNNTDISDSH